jgi:hypothetical protein
MQFRLRTLLIVLTLAPLLLALPWIRPRLFIIVLAYTPYAAFLFWQVRLRNSMRK